MKLFSSLVIAMLVVGVLFAGSVLAKPHHPTPTPSPTATPSPTPVVTPEPTVEPTPEPSVIPPTPTPEVTPIVGPKRTGTGVNLCWWGPLQWGWPGSDIWFNLFCGGSGGIYEPMCVTNSSRTVETGLPLCTKQCKQAECKVK